MWSIRIACRNAFPSIEIAMSPGLRHSTGMASVNCRLDGARAGGRRGLIPLLRPPSLKCTGRVSRGFEKRASPGSWILASVLVVAITFAGAASAKTPAPRHHPASQAPAVVHVVYTAPWPGWPISTPRYIYVPGGHPDPNAAMPTCDTTGDGCTAQQLCDLWGEC